MISYISIKKNILALVCVSSLACNQGNSATSENPIIPPTVTPTVPVSGTALGLQIMPAATISAYAFDALSRTRGELVATAVANENAEFILEIPTNVTGWLEITAVGDASLPTMRAYAAPATTNIVISYMTTLLAEVADNQPGVIFRDNTNTATTLVTDFFDLNSATLLSTVPQGPPFGTALNASDAQKYGHALAVLLIKLSTNLGSETLAQRMSAFATSTADDSIDGVLDGRGKDGHPTRFNISDFAVTCASAPACSAGTLCVDALYSLPSCECNSGYEFVEDACVRLIPHTYVNMLGVGMDVDWAKTRAGMDAYNTQAAIDFKNRGFKHIRLRVTEEPSDRLFAALDKEIRDCLNLGLIPILSYQADEFKNNPNDNATLNAAVAWWGTMAQRYKNYSHLLSYDLIIEVTDELNNALNRLLTFHEKAVAEIRKYDAERIIFISPRHISEARYLSELLIPTQSNGFVAAEWHAYAAGPSLNANSDKYWTTGTAAQKRLITDRIELALEWENQTGLPTWVGAWMAGNYNQGDNYSVAQQIEFANYFGCELKRAGIPYAVNADTQYYDRITHQWYDERAPVLDAILQPAMDCE